MRKALIATSALAFAGAMAAMPASAADMLSVGVGGYMQQWFGVADRDDDGADGGWAAQSDSEIHVKGSLESDAGLKFTVHMELEGDRGTNAIDESFVRVSGEFGQIEFGARDHAMVRMHYGISDVGIGLTSGDTQKWVPGTYLETAGHAIGNARKLNYITPRVSGLQVGVSYAPDDTAQDANTGAPNDNDNAGWGVAMNFQQDVGDMAVSFSLGHKSTDTAGTEIEYISGAVPASGQGDRITPLEMANNDAAIKSYTDALTLEAAGTLQDLQTAAQTAAADNMAAMDGMMTKGDDSTYTNAGVGVSFGAFKFNVAYATVDGGAYTTEMANMKITEDDASDFTGDWNATCGCIVDSSHTGDFTDDGVDNSAAESDSNNDPRNDYWIAEKVVEDKSKNADVWGVSVSYTDGPMSVSLGHMQHEDDAGGERTATMFSASYTLAPGVAWKSSIFGVEDTTSHKNVTGGKNEGNGFVTGITLGF